MKKWVVGTVVAVGALVVPWVPFTTPSGEKVRVPLWAWLTGYSGGSH